MQDTSDRIQPFPEQVSRWLTAIEWEEAWFDLMEKRVDVVKRRGSLDTGWAQAACAWVERVLQTTPEPLPEDWVVELRRVAERCSSNCAMDPPLDGRLLLRLDRMHRRLRAWVMSPLRATAWDRAGRACGREDLAT
ncbi:MAG TPA: hypothetical protein DEW46_11095 [Verrucomicrobia bacterium]|jgi:hypothetical protein|nr:hypothetical protein [Verrucomicrobiota bacterium]